MQLLDPAIVAPDAGPGRVDVHATELRWSHALAEHFERAPADVGADAEAVRRSRDRISGGRKERVVDHDSIPRGALQAECHVGTHPVGTPQVRVAGRLATQ